MQNSKMNKCELKTEPVVFSAPMIVIRSTSTTTIPLPPITSIPMMATPLPVYVRIHISISIMFPPVTFFAL